MGLNRIIIPTVETVDPPPVVDSEREEEEEEDEENKVVIKLHLESDGETLSVRRLVVKLSEASTANLRKVALRMARGQNEQDDNKNIPLREDFFRTHLYYDDDSGVRVEIGSDSELLDAIAQHILEGALTVTANVTIQDNFPVVLNGKKFFVRLHAADDDIKASRKWFWFALFFFVLPLLAQVVIARRSVRINKPRATASVPNKKHFTSSDELRRAVDEYMDDNSSHSIVARTYGHPIGTWDVSRIRSFESLFDLGRNPRSERFSEHLNAWDVSNGRNFARMFYGASRFRGDLSSWNMSKATKTTNMFHLAKRFNSDLSNWDVSSVIDMSGMFQKAESFQSDLSRWDVSSCRIMFGAFAGAAKFKSDLSKWDVSRVTDFRYMFYLAKSFRGEIRDWDISSSDKVDHMFGGLDESVVSRRVIAHVQGEESIFAV